MKMQRICLSPVLMLMVSQAAFATDDASLSELDAFWAEVSRTVAEGDFEGYKASYHEDAILVSGPSKTSYLIEQAFDRWEQGFTDTKAGKMEASVEFRFTQRFNDADTAHETGMFYYSTKAETGERTDSYAHFETLLIKKNGWKIMMEYQKSAATQAQWDAAR